MLLNPVVFGIVVFALTGAAVFAVYAIIRAIQLRDTQKGTYVLAVNGVPVVGELVDSGPVRPASDDDYKAFVQSVSRPSSAADIKMPADGPMPSPWDGAQPGRAETTSEEIGALLDLIDSNPVLARWKSV